MLPECSQTHQILNRSIQTHLDLFGVNSSCVRNAYSQIHVKPGNGCIYWRKGGHIPKNLAFRCLESDWVGFYPGNSFFNSPTFLCIRTLVFQTFSPVQWPQCHLWPVVALHGRQHEVTQEQSRVTQPMVQLAQKQVEKVTKEQRCHVLMCDNPNPELKS